MEHTEYEYSVDSSIEKKKLSGKKRKKKISYNICNLLQINLLNINDSVNRSPVLDQASVHPVMHSGEDELR